MIKTLQNLVLRKLPRVLQNERGSASVEFVVLALPLFVPIFIFLHQFAAVSGEEEIARTLAREGVRAYVSSSNSDHGASAMQNVIQKTASEIGLSKEQLGRMAIGLKCSATPCHSPNARIEVTIHFGATSELRAVTASAQEYISPWS
jgi:Flp pilus assembly protein TadG